MKVFTFIFFCTRLLYFPRLKTSKKNVSMQQKVQHNTLIAGSHIALWKDTTILLHYQVISSNIKISIVLNINYTFLCILCVWACTLWHGGRRTIFVSLSSSSNMSTPEIGLRSPGPIAVTSTCSFSLTNTRNGV